jgi:hypothetical protein
MFIPIGSIRSHVGGEIDSTAKENKGKDAQLKVHGGTTNVITHQ